MKKVLVTGGSGKLGRACIEDLMAHGYHVTNLDIAGHREQPSSFIRTDLSNYGAVLEAISGSVDENPGPFEGVVHLGAVPAPGLLANSETFKNNVAASYNIFQACRATGIKNIVFASSETVLGLPFDTPPPYVPVDEEYAPRPESAYSLGKVLDETMAAQFCRWDPDLKMFGLRFSNVMYEEEYAAFPSFDDDAKKRIWNLWAYIDARDGSQAIRKALESDLKGFETFVIANQDGVMSRTNDDLLNENFPGIERKRSFGDHETLLSIEKAKKMLGYAPQYSWRDYV